MCDEPATASPPAADPIDTVAESAAAQSFLEVQAKEESVEETVSSSSPTSTSGSNSSSARRASDKREKRLLKVGVGQ